MGQFKAVKVRRVSTGKVKKLSGIAVDIPNQKLLEAICGAFKKDTKPPIPDTTVIILPDESQIKLDGKKLALLNWVENNKIDIKQEHTFVLRTFVKDG